MQQGWGEEAWNAGRPGMSTWTLASPGSKGQCTALSSQCSHLPAVSPGDTVATVPCTCVGYILYMMYHIIIFKR